MKDRNINVTVRFEYGNCLAKRLCMGVQQKIMHMVECAAAKVFVRVEGGVVSMGHSWQNVIKNRSEKILTIKVLSFLEARQ